MYLGVVEKALSDHAHVVRQLLGLDGLLLQGVLSSLCSVLRVQCLGFRVQGSGFEVRG